MTAPSYIHVKVTAGARSEEWKEKSPDHFEAKVREKATRNMANERVLELAAKHLGIPRSRVRIAHGHRSPSKLIAIQ